MPAPAAVAPASLSEIRMPTAPLDDEQKRTPTPTRLLLCAKRGTRTQRCFWRATAKRSVQGSRRYRVEHKAGVPVRATAGR